MKKSIFLVLLGSSAILSGCTSSVATPEMERKVERVEFSAIEGESLFGEKCGMCHRERGMGTGILERRMDAELALLENRKDLNPEFIDVVVRNGFNTMFPLSRIEVSNQELDAIAKHLSQ